MKKFYSVMLLLFAVSMTAKGGAKRVELGGIKFTKTATKHFTVLTSKGCSKSNCCANAEAVWGRMVKMFPSMAKLISTEKDAPRPVLVYLSDKDEYQKFGYFVKRHLKASGMDRELESAERLYEHTSTWQLFQFDGTSKPNEDWPFCGQVVLNNGPRKKIASGRTHFLSTLMFDNYMKNTPLPFGLSAGLGYEYEISMSRNSYTRYMDYTNADSYSGADIEGQINTSKIFDKGGNKWASLIRKQMRSKKGRKGSLTISLSVSPANLTPVEAGYVYALSRFMTQDEGHCKKFEKFIELLKDGGDTNESLLKAYGFDSIDDMEKAWYKYMLGNKFR